MRISLLAAGSLGDVLPYLAIASALVRRGHRVRFASGLQYEEVMTAAGAELFSLGDQDARKVWADLGAGRPTRNPVSTLRYLFRHKGGMDEGLSRQAEACRGADVVVTGTSTAAAAQAALAVGTPVVGCHLSPWETTSRFPRPIGPRWAHRLRLGPAWNWLSHEVVGQLFWAADRACINRWRVEELGLPPLPWLRGYRWTWRARIPLLFGYSPSLLRRPADWPEWYHVTGYWSGFEPFDWRPPADLMRFLESGAPVVFLGFGSMLVAPELWKVMVDGCLQAGARVILGAGPTDTSARLSDERVHVVGHVPYRWLFPRVTIVAHHCGAGTVGEALRAGVRSVLVPFTGEQRFWAERLHDARVAPAPLNSRTLTAHRFACVLRSVLQNGSWKTRAETLGRQVAAEDGVGTAVRLIEQYAQRPGIEAGPSDHPAGRGHGADQCD
jgi:UDP:flavonoid glycosyltransferase YjiC (YdhE family)